MPVKVKFWKQDLDQGNFGDTLSLMYMDRMFEAESRFDVGHVYLVGSVIEESRIRMAIRNGFKAGDGAGQAIFWGCGKQNGNPLAEELAQKTHFLGVRGTHTRDALNLPATTPLGDTAFALKEFYKPTVDPETAGKVLWVPHVNSNGPTEEQLDSAGDSIVKSPMIPNTPAGCEAMINSIASAKFVMANAMHVGLIAMTYGVPFCFWGADKVNFPFKWVDVLSPFGIKMVHQPSYTAALLEYERVRPDKALQDFSIDPILKVAPFKLKR